MPRIVWPAKAGPIIRMIIALGVAPILCVPLKPDLPQLLAGGEVVALEPDAGKLQDDDVCGPGHGDVVLQEKDLRQGVFVGVQPDFLEKLSRAGRPFFVAAGVEAGQQAISQPAGGILVKDQAAILVLVKDQAFDENAARRDRLDAGQTQHRPRPGVLDIVLDPAV